MLIRQITVSVHDFFADYLKPSSPDFAKRVVQISALAISVISFLGFLATKEPGFLVVSIVSLMVGLSLFSDSPSYRSSSYDHYMYAPPSHTPSITHHVYHQVPTPPATVYRTPIPQTYLAPAPTSYDLASRGSLRQRQQSASAVLPTAPHPITLPTAPHPMTLPTAPHPMTPDLAARGSLRRRIFD
jgi:hypothetical protein